MKYIVELKYTNPAHEHVSLRRRVDTINRVVEAVDADEAINRATRQQRSLGFIIREAKVLEAEPKEKEEVVDKKTLDKEEDTKISAAKGGAEKASMKEEAINEARATHDDVYNSLDARNIAKKPLQNFGYPLNKVPPHIKAAQAKSDALSKVAKRPQAGTLAAHKSKENDSVHAINRAMEREMERNMKKEEVEQVDETAQKEDPLKARQDWANAKHPVWKDPRKQKAAQTKRLMQTFPLKTEEVEYIEEKLTADDPASKWIHDFVHSDNPKFEGKSKKERISMALGAKYAANRAVKEEVESVEEANMRFDYEAAARPKASDVKNFLNRDTDRRAGAASKKYIRRMTKLGGLGPNQTKKDTEAHMKAHFEEVEQTDEARKISRVEWRMGTEDTVDKNNKKIFDKLSQTDPAKAKAFHDNLMRMKKKDVKEEAVKEPPKALEPTPKQNPNQKTTLSPSNPSVQKDDKIKEAVDPGKTRVVNKKVKAAEKMINAAKGKVNKVNFEPTAEIPATHSHALSLRQQ